MNRTMQIALVILITAYLFCSFVIYNPLKETPYELKIPTGFPEPYIPEDNKLTKERVQLGRKLFFDPILSKDRSISCSTCHMPDRSFSDDKTFSFGVGGSVGERN